MKIRWTGIRWALTSGAILSALALAPSARADDQLTAFQLPNAVPLKTIATIHRLHATGKGWKAFVCYPVFTAATPLTAAADLRLRRDCLKEFAAFIAEAKSNVGAGVINLPLEYQQAPQVTLYEPNHLISTADLGYDYEGGAHGQYGVTCITFGQVGTKARVLTLGDFFLPGTDYHTRVSAALVAKLKNTDGADWAQDGSMGPVTIDQLNNFSVYPEGLMWHFNPYEAGPFSSGIIDVKLTWAELGAGLNKAVLP